MNKYRTEIYELIEAIDPLDGRERSDRELALRWVASQADLFRGEQKHLPDPHLVTYFLPVDLVTRQALLVEHRTSGLILPPGGHVDAGELPDKTVVRECQEELGVTAEFAAPWGAKPLFLTATRTRVTGATIPAHTDITLWYVLRLAVHAELSYQEAQVPGGYWCSFTDLKAMPSSETDSELARFVAKFERSA